MTDEKFVFVSDVRDKKRTASGAFHKRTHAGKGGAVKFPSDYLSRKELNAMNGETKSYNLNSPMTWDEFKAMPDDIKCLYVKAIRDKYHVSDTTIFKMFGINQATGQRHFKTLGLCLGKGCRTQKADKNGWFKWISGVREPEDTESMIPDIVPEQEDTLPEESGAKPIVPVDGTMTFEGTAADALRMVEQLLQDAVVRISVTWTSCGSEG